jgi:hypothetical protein
MLNERQIFEIAAEAIGNPLLADDLEEGFTVHTESRDWIGFAKQIEKLARQKALHDAYIAVGLCINISTADMTIRKLMEQSEESGD